MTHRLADQRAAVPYIQHRSDNVPLNVLLGADQAVCTIPPNVFTRVQLQAKNIVHGCYRPVKDQPEKMIVGTELYHNERLTVPIPTGQRLESVERDAFFGNNPS